MPPVTHLHFKLIMSVETIIGKKLFIFTLNAINLDDIITTKKPWIDIVDNRHTSEDKYWIK